MKFAEAFAAEPRHRQGPDCGMCVFMAALPEGERADVQAAMESDATTAVIYRALKRSGHDVSLHALGRHRRQECSGLRRGA